MTPMEWLTTLMTMVLAAVCWRRDVRWVAFFVLVYSVLYFLPSIEVLFDGSGLSEISSLHFRGSSTAVKVQGILALGVAGFALWRCTRPVTWRRWYGALALLSGLLGTGLILDGGVVSRMQLLNVLSVALMFGGVSLGADAWERCAIASRRDGAWVMLAALLLTLLLASVGLAWWEIANDKAWARFNASSGHLVQRASAMMFNPNLYALWCSVLGILAALLWQARLLSGRDGWLLSGVVLAGLGIFLSSSRSVGYLLLVFLMGTALLLPRNHGRRWAPLLAYLLALLAASVAAMVAWRAGDSDGTTVRYVVLAERLLAAPLQLAAVLPLSLPSGLSDASGPMVSPETVLAFEGRFQGEGRDSGWLTAFDDAGLLGVLALAVFWGAQASYGVRACLRQRDLYTVYALGLVGYGVAVGVVMRYQSYPVWVFLAVLLAPCVALWRAVLPGAGPVRRVWL